MCLDSMSNFITNDMKDFITAFEADIRKAGGKTIMKWNK